MKDALDRVSKTYRETGILGFDDALDDYERTADILGKGDPIQIDMVQSFPLFCGFFTTFFIISNPLHKREFVFGGIVEILISGPELATTQLCKGKIYGIIDVPKMPFRFYHDVDSPF